MSENNEPKHGEGFTANDWRTAWEQEAEENKHLRLRMEDLERSAASAREIARVAMTHTGTQAVRVEMCVRNGSLQLIVCDPRGDEFEQMLGNRIVELLQAHKWLARNLGQIGSSD